MKRVRGLTLVELLVALLIVALIAVLAWRALAQAAQTRARIAADNAAWLATSRALGRVESELAQAASRRGGPSSPALRFELAGEGGSRLVFWRADPLLGARLSGLAADDEGLALLRWPRGAGGAPEREPLLPGARALRWSFVAAGEADWRDDWPPSVARRDELPSGVRLSFELPGFGRIQRVFALQ